MLDQSIQGFVVPIVIHCISQDKTSVSHRLRNFTLSTFTSDGLVAWLSVPHWLGTGPRVIRDLLGPSTSGTCTGHLTQASLDAKYTFCDKLLVNKV